MQEKIKNNMKYLKLFTIVLFLVFGSINNAQVMLLPLIRKL